MPELVCAADDPRWLAERRAGVTATDITAITGLSPYESAYSLYWKKLGHISDTHEDNDRMRLGRDLEPIIIGRWCEEHPALAVRQGAALYRSSERPWQLATPDRTVHVSDLGAVLEVKSWADADRHAWDDAPPPRVRAQVLWQMDTLDVATGHVGVLFLPSGEFRSYVIEHDRSAHETGNEPQCSTCIDLHLMRDAAEEFMARIRHELPPPSPDASSATLAALKARFTDPRKDKQAEIDGDLWGSFVAAKVTSEHFADQAREHEIVIREQAGDAGILTVAGIPVARHTISIVKAHQRKESRRDSITRIKNGETSE